MLHGVVSSLQRSNTNRAPSHTASCDGNAGNNLNTLTANNRHANSQVIVYRAGRKYSSKMNIHVNDIKVITR